MEGIQTEVSMDRLPSKAAQASIVKAVLLSLGFGCETRSCHIFSQMSAWFCPWDKCACSAATISPCLILIEGGKQKQNETEMRFGLYIG